MKAIIATTVFGVIMMFAGLMVNDKKSVSTIAVLLFAALLGVNIWDLVTTPANAPQLFFSNMLRVEHYSLLFNTLMTGCSLLYVLLMGKEIQKV